MEADRRSNGTSLWCVRDFFSYSVALLTHLRTVYYRLYTMDGVIESYNPVYSNDLFTSRILPKFFGTPASSLKKHICKIEGLARSNASLFESLSSIFAIEDSTHLKLCGHFGAGISSREPMALLVGVAEAKKRSDAPRVGNELIENPDSRETRYSTCDICVIVLHSHPTQYITAYTMKRVQ